MMTSNISEKSIWCYVTETYYFYMFLYTKKTMYDKSTQITLGHVWTIGCYKWWTSTEQRFWRKSTAIPTSFSIIRKIIDNKNIVTTLKQNWKTKTKKKKCKNHFSHDWVIEHVFSFKVISLTSSNLISLWK